VIKIMNSDRKIIISCTTTSDRMDMLFYVIESIKKQSLTPNLLYINISSEAYLNDDGIKNLPNWLNQDFINVNWVENAGPYRKLIPVIDKIGDNDIVVTIDDDVLYGPGWLQSLVALADTFSDHIICARARNMKKNIFGKWQSYFNWEPVQSAAEGRLVLPIGCGGVLYRKKLLDNDFLVDSLNFMRLAPASDDLWYKMASLRMNTSVYVSPQIDKDSIYLQHHKGLEQENRNLQDNFFQKIIKMTTGKILGWLGFSLTNNDHAWSKITKYSKRTMNRPI
jgi:hypothetical protein